MELSPAEKKIFTRLQRGIEPVSQPFQALEEKMGGGSASFQALELSEADVLALLHRAKEAGLLRRFGGVFDARRLGYKSILCALDVPDELIEKKAAIISAHPGVTHCYERTPLCGEGVYPKLWFTLAVLHDEFDDEINNLNSELRTGNSELYELPAIHRFKIDVVFNLNTVERDETFPGNVASPDVSFVEFSEEEKALVRALDQQIPLVARPFAAVAEQIGQTEEFVLSTLRVWKEQGVLRRIGAILYHREAGFKANAMCVWPVDGDVSAAGRRVAARPEVSHCYQRPRLASFPFDLYAMIHTRSWDETRALFEDISASCGLKTGELFASGREFKKSSMKYFKS